MKLYMRQKVFSWADRFTVKDEYGQDRYFVKGELFSLGKKLHVCDQSDRERAYIHQKVFAFMPRFSVYIDGQKVAQIVQKLTFFKQRYVVEGLGWEVSGDFWAHNYDIRENGRLIVQIHKQWMSWGDSYELEIADPSRELLALAVVLAIDCAMADSAAASSAAT
jgi:uncharacterized protein YxjI